MNKYFRADAFGIVQLELVPCFSFRNSYIGYVPYQPIYDSYFAFREFMRRYTKKALDMGMKRVVPCQQQNMLLRPDEQDKVALYS